MIGCLCIHGFTGGPYEIEPLAAYLRETTDWTIEAPTLPGHGETLQLKGITYDQWLHAAEEEMQKLRETCDTIYVIGFSMGGVIATYLATKYSVEKLVLLSPAFYYVNLPQLLKEIRRMIRDGFRRQLYENPLFVRYKEKLIATPWTATLEFRKLVNEVRPRLPLVQVPVLIAQGEEDGIVPPKSAQYVYETIGSKEKQLLFLPSSRHHVCHEPDCQILFRHVEAFLKENF